MIQPKQIVRDVVDSQYFAVLNSVGEGRPYSNLVAFAITDDWKSLVFVTDRNTHKYENIKENNRVALLIDNRNNQPSDVTEAIAITVLGAAREASDTGSDLQAIFLDRHPHLRPFVTLPGTALIHVTVHEYIIAGFEKTEHIILSE